MRITFFILFTLSSLSQLISQASVDSLIAALYNKYDRVTAYSVDALINVDVDFINMPAKTAQVYFKKPDSIQVETDGFLMLPKFGMRPITRYLDMERYQAVLRGTENLNGHSYQVINLIPTRGNQRIILNTIWVDQTDLVIKQMELSTRKHGTYTVEMTYGSEILPKRLIISFELDAMNIPMRYFGNDVEVDKERLKNAEAKTGKVLIDFDKYVIHLADPTNKQ